jgi:sec-independent protein translocase protein TatC
MTQNLRTQPTPINHSAAGPTAQQTLLDHLRELRTRLFWIVVALLIATSLGYVIQDQIMAALMRPLGGQHLVYLTPIGGFNFIFKVSLYFGIGVILPVLIYHLYRFLEPLMDRRHKRSVTFYSMASFLLAIGGASFAYFGSLPAAMRFLTGFDIQNVSAMLTVDSYLAFVITYVLGFAALFQIPLILLIINTIKPIPPKKLLSFERFVVLGAFIVAALISPTPDITNQAILAIPIILMYQIGVVLVWLQGRSQRRRDKAKTAAVTKTPASTPQPVIRRQFAPVASPVAATPQPATSITPRPTRRPRPVMDIAAPRPRTPVRSAPTLRHMSEQRTRQTARPMQSRPLSRPTSIDGIVARRASAAS